MDLGKRSAARCNLRLGSSRGYNPAGTIVNGDAMSKIVLMSFAACLCISWILTHTPDAPAQTATHVAYDGNRKFSRDRLQKDFLIFRRSLEESQASLYRYKSKRVMDKWFDAAFKSLNRDMTEREFYRILTSVLSATGDGHNYSFLSSGFRSYLSQSAKIFPLKLRYIEGKAYVIASPVPEISPDCELISVNGRTMNKITGDLFRHLVADGDVQTGKYWKLNERFGYFYYLFEEQPDSFSIEYYDQLGKRKKAEITALTQTEVERLLKQKGVKSGGSNQKPLRFELLGEPHAALLTIETFDSDAIKQAGQDFPQFISSAFEKAREQKVQDLIVDMRGNDGGDDYGPLLLSYLTNKDFRYVDHIEAATNKPSFILNYTHLSVDFLNKFSASLIPDGKGRYLVKGEAESDLSVQKPHENSYANRVWFITNGETFSATAMFCDIVRGERRGAFVGEETGGAYEGNSAGEFVVITLPETGIKVLVPLEAYFMAVSPSPYPARGVIPDYRVQPTIEDILNGKDAELSYTLELIKKYRKK
jgi:Peptidase family S41